MSGAATDRPSGSSLRARRLARLTGLYAITPDLDDTPRLVALCAAALDGGAVAIQYRNKSAPPALAFEQATALVALARGRGALLVVNDDPALAAHVDADGVHVGTDDGGVARARAIVGPDRLVGASCYDRVEDARDAVAQGADHVAFGSFYASPTKPQARRAGLDLPARARALGVPIVAIGGIDERNAGELARAGVDAIAAIQAVFGDARPAGVAAAARRVASAFAAGRAGDRSSGGAPATIPPAARGGASRPSLPGAQPMSRNDELFARAQRTIPAGVNSPVRAFRSVGGTPRFLVRGEGPYVWDADGRRYTDYVGSWGPAIVGHAHPAVVAAVQKTAVHGVSFGAPTEIEIEMAETLVRRLPSLELVRLVSSGTEATMSALRLARGFTGRPKIVKFEGCYHGHGDSLLVKAGSGALTFGQPSSAGVPPEIANQTIVLPYNDAAALEAAFAADGASIAGVIVEPVAGNMNLVHPAPGFLERLRRVCDRHGAVLIFDEVMTGFRVHPRGVQGMTGVTPDLTTLGKVIGGGMPVGAFGGRRDIMNLIAPLGPVYQAGTLSGNPVAVAAGLATLALTEAPGFYETLSARTRALTDGLMAAAKRAGVPFCAQAVGGMFGLYFAPRVPSSYAEIMACDKERFNRYFHAMLDAGVYFAPSAYEAGFVSAAHTDADIADTIERASGAFSRLA